MNKILIITVLALVASFGQVNATVVTAPAIIAAGSVVISSPPASQVTVIKAIRMCNDTTAAVCVNMYDGGNLIAAKNVGMMCADKQTCSNTPVNTQSNAAAKTNSLAGFFGELLTIAGQFVVSSPTPTVAAAGGITFTVSYEKPVR